VAKKNTKLFFSFNIHLENKTSRVFLFKSILAYLNFVVKFCIGFFLIYFKDFFGF